MFKEELRSHKRLSLVTVMALNDDTGGLLDDRKDYNQ